MGDEEKMVNLDPPGTEKSPFVPWGGPVTSDDLIEELVRKRTWKYTVMVLWLMVCWLGAPCTVYITSFAGISPAATDTWICKSEKCEKLVEANSSILSEFPCEITKDVNGTKELVLNPSDIEWKLPHTSFAVDFDLYCNIGSRKEMKTLISSIFFAGALTGLIIGGFLFDHIGRKKTVILGYVIAVVVTFIGTFCHDYTFLLVIRFLQGIGIFLLSTGLYILTIEVLPAKYRNYANGWAMGLWALGYPIAAGVGYFITDWNFMFLGASIVLVIMNIQVLFCIESPRYYLINNDVESAKESLKALAALTNSELDIDNIEIADVGKVKERNHSVKEQLIDLWRYPTLLLETLMQMFLWFIIAMSYYGFNFGWGTIVPDMYLGYLMAMVGELIGYYGSVLAIAYLGRRKAMMLMFIGAAVFYLIAILDVNLGKDWALESVCSLIGIIFVSGCFSGIYLWTGELAPTSHRGFVFCVSSSAARIGSFLGPYIFNNLAPITHKAVPLGGLAFLSLLCALGSFLLVETGDKETALTGGDVVARRKSYRYRI